MTVHTERANPFEQPANGVDIAAAMNLRDCLRGVATTILVHGPQSQATGMLAVLASTGLLILDNCKPEERAAGLDHASRYFAAMAGQFRPGMPTTPPAEGGLWNDDGILSFEPRPDFEDGIALDVGRPA